MQIRETSDSGAPIVVSDPESIQAQIYRDIAELIWDRLSEERMLAGGHG